MLTIKDDKLYVVSEKPMSVLWDDQDINPSHTLPLKECAKIGLQQVIAHFGHDLPLFRTAAQRALNTVHEQSIYSPAHRASFADFVAVMQDSFATDEKRLEHFKRLDPQLQAFFAFIVDVATHLENPHKDGKNRIDHQPHVLNSISSIEGIDIL